MFLSFLIDGMNNRHNEERIEKWINSFGLCHCTLLSMTIFLNVLEMISKGVDADFLHIRQSRGLSYAVYHYRHSQY